MREKELKAKLRENIRDGKKEVLNRQRESKDRELIERQKEGKDGVKIQEIE